MRFTRLVLLQAEASRTLFHAVESRVVTACTCALSANCVGK